MKFKIWLENTELLLILEDYKTALERFAKENPQTPREAIRKYIDEFRTIVTKKYRQISDAIPDVSVPIPKRNNIDAYATFRELEAVVDHVKGQVDFHGKVNFKDVDVDAKPVLENDSIVIYHADSPRACIKYKGNIPYSWCVARNDSANLYHAYRFKDHEPSFYFVKNKKRTQEEFKLWNLVKTSFQGKFKDPYHFFVVQVLKGAKPEDHEKQQYVVTSANNDSDKLMSWREIVAIEPLLEGLENLFKNMPLSDEERKDHIEFSRGLSDDQFARLPYERKNRYLDIYIRLSRGLTDAQFASLPEDLRNKYIGFGVGLSDKQYELIKGTKLDRRYVDVTLTKIKNMSGRDDVPMELTKSEKAILIANPDTADLSVISTNNIVHLLGGMDKKKERLGDEDGHEQEGEWEGDYEEIDISRHAAPEQRKDDQRIAEMIISNKKDLDKYDVAALLRHSPNPDRTIKALGEKINLLDEKLLKFVRDYRSKARPEYNTSLSDALFDSHSELDTDSLSHVLHSSSNPEKVIQGILNRYPDKPLGYLTLQLLEKAKDKDGVLDALLRRENAFSGIYPGGLGKFYFGNHHGDFLNSLRGDRRQRLAERIAEDNKEAILKWEKQKIIDHNPIAILMLMASDKRRILDILGEEVLNKVAEDEVNTIFLLSDPEESEKFAEFMSERLSHKNMISLLMRAKNKIKVFDKMGQEGVDNISADYIMMIMNNKQIDEKEKRVIADEIVKRKSEFKFGGAHIHWHYLKSILDHVSDKLRSAMDIVSKVKTGPEIYTLQYMFGNLNLESEDMQKLVEFTLENKDLSDQDFLAVLGAAPDKQKAIEAAGEERVKKAVNLGSFNSENYPPLRDVVKKYKTNRD